MTASAERDAPHVEALLRDLVAADLGYRIAEHNREQAVAAAVAAGANWREIGDVLGVTRQSARERFGVRS